MHDTEYKALIAACAFVEDNAEWARFEIDNGKMSGLVIHRWNAFENTYPYSKDPEKQKKMHIGKSLTIQKWPVH